MGDDSKCIPTNSGGGRCYRTACVKDEMALKINVRGEWLTCENDFQELNVRVGAGAFPQTLICPRLSVACPDLFCPFGCAGRGICNYAHTVNGTSLPRCECFDKDDTSPGCSDSLVARTPLKAESPTESPTKRPISPPTESPTESTVSEASKFSLLVTVVLVAVNPFLYC